LLGAIVIAGFFFILCIRILLKDKYGGFDPEAVRKAALEGAVH
jgi:hypothetical protein